MRKSFSHNFRFYFLLILTLHVTALFLHLKEEQKKITDQTEVTRKIKVRIVQGFDPSRQIVESEDPTEKTIPKANARLSDKDRSFDRQTRARVVKSFQKGEKGAKGKKGMSLSDLGGDLGKQNPLREAAREYAAAKNSETGTAGGRSVSSTSDHLADIPLGDLTHLNTVEYKFFGYYHRIRQKLEGFWGRSVQEKAAALAEEGRAIASEDSHITALRIVMNSAGEIVDVAILGSSGVKELDDAAIESFNEAGPFPNPPKDLIVDGRVTIEWGFVVNS